jgi:hypothetical protein
MQPYSRWKAFGPTVPAVLAVQIADIHEVPVRATRTPSAYARFAADSNGQQHLLSMQGADEVDQIPDLLGAQHPLPRRHGFCSIGDPIRHDTVWEIRRRRNAC